MTTIAFTGDIAFSGYFKDKYNDAILDEKIISFLKESDYTVANVEGAITDIESDEEFNHANPSETISFLKSINANVWNLANNHAFNNGVPGILDTIENAKKNGARILGAGDMDEIRKPIIFGENEIGIVAVSFTGKVRDEEKNIGQISWDDPQLENIIANVKSKCKWCIVVAHGGEEFCTLPLRDTRKRYLNYLRYGADIVVAHHPHVVQNYEAVGDKIIFYSLGNFVFDTNYQRTQKHTENGVVIKIEFGEDSFRWESLALKIDRKMQKIMSIDNHDIFVNIDAKRYKKLYPLAAKSFGSNLQKKLEYLRNTKLSKRAVWEMRKRLIKRHGFVTMISEMGFYKIKKYDSKDPIVKYIKES